MKPLILTIFLITLSAPVCFGEWTGVTEGEDGNTYYVDFERIKERRGYIYYWYLTDYPKPNKDGWCVYCGHLFYCSLSCKGCKKNEL